MDSDLDKIIDENFSEHYRSIKGGYYKGVWLPEEYLKIADEIENFKIRDDDVWVCSFPRSGKFCNTVISCGYVIKKRHIISSGSTWTQEMVWCICTDLDYEKAKIPSLEKFLYLEYVQSYIIEYFLNYNLAGYSITFVVELQVQPLQQLQCERKDFGIRNLVLTRHLNCLVQDPLKVTCLIICCQKN